jgi:hypothetical protein
MADNVTIPATGTGTATPVVATDDVAGAHFQKVKLDVGGDGESIPLSSNDPLPVTMSGAIVTIQTSTGGLKNSSTNTDAIAASAETDALKVGSHGFVYNGTSWDRLRGDTLGLHISRSATSATATLLNVDSSTTSGTLVAANATRKGASIHNDSTAVLYVKFGATASATSFTVKMAADAHYEVPFGYTGRIDGIWASANGAARVTELT